MTPPPPGNRPRARQSTAGYRPQPHRCERRRASTRSARHPLHEKLGEPRSSASWERDTSARARPCRRSYGVQPLDRGRGLSGWRPERHGAGRVPHRPDARPGWPSEAISEARTRTRHLACGRSPGFILHRPVTVAVAIVAAIWMARSLAGPLEELAHQAGEVVEGEPRPVAASRQPRDLAWLSAFNKALEDLVQAPQAARHDRAHRRTKGNCRRVAHEIKNPLAPIRAAVETLRRLRARNDPAFDDYFDEATQDRALRGSSHHQDRLRVHRVCSAPGASSGAGFARRNRQEHRCALRRGRRRRHASSIPLPPIQADRDQLVQVLTNLDSERSRCGGRQQPEG